MLTIHLNSYYFTSEVLIYTIYYILDHNNDPQSEFHSKLYDDGRELRIYNQNSTSDIKMAMLFPDGATKERLIDGSLRICFTNQGKNYKF